jgi:hypothetical protein
LPLRVIRTLSELIEWAGRRSSSFRNELLRSLRAASGQLTPEEAWYAWRGLLRAALRAEERDGETAREALDALEVLAHSGIDPSRLLDLLDDPREWSPAWTAQEAEEVKFRLYERAGRLDEARSILISLANQAISDDDEMAGDFVEMLRNLGAQPDDLRVLEARLAARPSDNDESACAPVVSRSALAQRLRIMFVGGNEMQQRYRDRLIESFAKTHPHVELDFEFPGWGANWGPLLARIEGRVRQADALIIMRFVRTLMGRALRRLASECEIPWVACTGRGHRSIERAIGNALRAAGTTRTHRAVGAAAG